MATYTMYAYVGTDTPSKLGISTTDKSIDVASKTTTSTTSYIDWSAFTRIEVVLKYVVNDVDTFLTVDSVANPDVFSVGGDTNSELTLYLGHVPSIAVGTTYQMRLIGYDATQNDDGRVLVDYSTDKNTDTVIVKAN